MSEPLKAEQTPEVGPTRVRPRVVLVCAAVVALAAGWAFRPLPPRSIPAPLEETPETTASSPMRVALDVDAFRAPIWVQPPPSEPAPDAPPPQPLKIQLLAILRDGEVYRAALYDPDADRLFVAATGEAVAGRVIERVTADSVGLLDRGEVRTLSLAAGGTP